MVVTDQYTERRIHVDYGAACRSKTGIANIDPNMLPI